MNEVILFLVQIGVSLAALRGMASPDYRVRERATVSYAYGGYPGVLLAEAVSRYGDDLEVARRAARGCQKVIDREVQQLAPFPYLDSFWYNVVKRDYTPWDDLSHWANANLPGYIALAQEGPDPRDADQEFPYYGSYRTATRLWVTDCLKKGIPPFVMRTVLRLAHYRTNIFLDRARKGPQGGNFGL